MQGCSCLGGDKRKEASDDCTAQFPKALNSQSPGVGPASNPMRGANKTGM